MPAPPSNMRPERRAGLANTGRQCIVETIYLQPAAGPENNFALSRTASDGLIVTKRRAVRSLLSERDRRALLRRSLRADWDYRLLFWMPERPRSTSPAARAFCPRALPL